MQAKPDPGPRYLGHEADQALGPSQLAQSVLWAGQPNYLEAFLFIIVSLFYTLKMSHYVIGVSLLMQLGALFGC